MPSARKRKSPCRILHVNTFICPGDCRHLHSAPDLRRRTSQVGEGLRLPTMRSAETRPAFTSTIRVFNRSMPSMTARFTGIVALLAALFSAPQSPRPYRSSIVSESRRTLRQRSLSCRLRPHPCPCESAGTCRRGRQRLPLITPLRDLTPKAEAPKQGSDEIKLRALPLRAPGYSPFGFWLPPRSFARNLSACYPGIRLSDRFAFFSANPGRFKILSHVWFGPEGQPESTPASFGPSPALRLLPSRALSS